MNVLLTFAALTMTMAVAIALRLRWPRMAAPRRRRLATISALLVTPTLLPLVTKWDVTNQSVQDAEAWLRIVACQFAVVFLTLLRPRLLTVTTAVILLPLAFTTSVAGPLSTVFLPRTYTTKPVTDGYYLETVPWESLPDGNSGVEFELFYKRSPTGLLRREIMGGRLYNTQCRTEQAYATLRRETHTLYVHCPPLPTTEPAAALSGTLLHFLIPRRAMAPDLVGQRP